MTRTKGQDRLDRLEKMAESMSAGIGELRAFQAETSEQIRQLRPSQGTYAEERREAQRRIDQELLSLKEARDRTDDQLNRTIRKLDDIGGQLGDLGLVQGEIAEDLFYRNLRGVFRKTKMDLKKVKRNLKRKGEGGFDLVAVDRGRVLVVEVKNKLEKRMMDRFVERKLSRFREMFPEYEKYQVVGAMGALVVKDDVGRYGEKAGLYMMTQTDDGGATLLNREGFEPKTFD